MKSFCIVVLFVGLLGLAHAQPAQKSAAECGSDSPGKYMKMSPSEFDKTLGEGWREIGDKEGCETAGADLIAMYRDNVLAQHVAGLDGHEAQLRAASGDYAKAIELFRRKLVFTSKMAAETGDLSDVLYIEATIAFLDRDLGLLHAKRAALAALPKPDWYDATAADYVRRVPAAAAAMKWPRNLNVVDGLMACFDRPYREAYAFACQSTAVE